MGVCWHGWWWRWGWCLDERGGGIGGRSRMTRFMRGRGEDKETRRVGGEESRGVGDGPDGGEVGDGGDESGGISGERCDDAGTGGERAYGWSGVFCIPVMAARVRNVWSAGSRLCCLVCPIDFSHSGAAGVVFLATGVGSQFRQLKKGLFHVRCLDALETCTKTYICGLRHSLLPRGRAS